MPPPVFPPTPASSTEIQGQDGSKQLASLQTEFELPPPALSDSNEAGRYFMTPTTAMDTDVNISPLVGPNTKSPSTSTTSPTKAYPVQAAETVKSRRRSSALQAKTQMPGAHTGAPSTSSAKNAFALPPPPTRSRKIIQMKPRTAATSGASAKGRTTNAKSESSVKGGRGGAVSAVATASASTSTAAAGTPATANTAQETSPKKKQPAAASAAGRKVARKTAHSLIERRRRSKMNEEFAVLKGMIPACTGEMHKLAILQASIEYVRYLEDCVATLKSQRGSEQHDRQQRADYSPLSPERPRAEQDDIDEDAMSPDVEMAGTGEADSDDNSRDEDAGEDEDDNEAIGNGKDEEVYAACQRTQKGHHGARHTSQSSTTSSRYSPHLTAAVSASLTAAAAAAADHVSHDQEQHPDRRHFSSFSYTPSGGMGGFTTSAQTSPAFGPQQYPLPPLLSAAPSVSGSTLTSPALAPQRDMDQEATAALLMLNSDRRGTQSGSIGGSGNGNTTTPGRGMSVQDLLST